MITLRVTFLLAVNSAREPAKKTPKKSGRKSGRKSSSKASSSKSSKSSKKKGKKGKAKSKESLHSVKETNYTEIPVQEPLAYLHLEYEIYTKISYKIDVVCWGPVAKIYSSSGVRCVKTIEKEDKIWIPVFMEHYIQEMSMEKLKAFMGHTISFSMKTGKNSTGNQAKSEKARLFYVFKEDDNGTDFVEVYTEKPKNEEDELWKREIDKIMRELLTFASKDEIVTWIHRKSAAHVAHISKIITKREGGLRLYCKFPEEPEPKDKNAGKKGKGKKGKGKKGKDKKKGGEKSEVLTFKVPAYVFLTDPRLATFQLRKTNKKILESFTLLSSENLFSQSQKCELNPLIVKIRKINNLPNDILLKNGFNGVYVKCQVPNFIEFNTEVRPISKTISFEESRFVYSNNIPPIKQLDVLQTSRAVLQILGVKESSGGKPSAGKSAGGKKKGGGKKKKGKKGKKGKPANDDPTAVLAANSVLLSVAYCDMSPLSNNYFLLKEHIQCHNISTVFMPNGGIEKDFFVDHRTLNEMNLVIPPNMFNPSPLSEGLLVTELTTVKFEANFLVPQYTVFYVRDTTYKRFLMVASQEEAAKLIFNSILIYNHEQLIGLGPVLVPTLYTRRISTPYCREAELGNDVLTGFVIDDGNSFIVFVEGPSNGFILSLLHQISGYNYSVARIYYNSEYLFEERLYDTFSKFNGFMIVNLTMPLVNMLATKELYLRGNVPVPCFKALQKLDLIFKSATFKTILNKNLLPTEVELFSLSAEFGVQFGFKGKETIILPNKSTATMSSSDCFKIQ